MAYTTINKHTDYFNTKLWTGTGSSNALTGVGFQPDFTWIKSRSDALSHALFDAVRGTTKVLNSNATTAEYTNTDTLTAFGTDGFTVGSNTGVNANGQTRVAWNWKAGTGQGSSNTDGSINTTYTSVNTTAGFSISKYTGTGSNATVGHGLGAVPKMIIAKNLDSSGGSAEHWTVFHHTLDTNKNLYLNLTNAEDTPSPEIYREGSFTNDVFAIGAHDRINKSGEGMIAYCFAEKQGYSKFGSYIGNGNADGTFVYTGFKPAFVLVKSSSTGGTYYHWGMWDTARSPSNVNDKILAANTSDDESNASNLGAGQNIDFLSNGFKHRSADVVNNQSGTTYIYMAFGQSLVGSNNIPATAR